MLETPPGFAALPFEMATALDRGEIAPLVEYLFAEFSGVDRWDPPRHSEAAR